MKRVRRLLLKTILISLITLRQNRLFLRLVGIEHGTYCRIIKLKSSTFGSEPYLVSLGSNITISNDVQFLTHDGGVHVFRQVDKSIDRFAPIQVGDNVFIGYGSIILPGTVIGNNTVIGAGSVVRGKVEGNAVYAGVPAKKIKTIEQYYQDIKDEFLPTNGMEYFEKRNAIKQMQRASKLHTPD